MLTLERDFCGMLWEPKPDLLWVDESGEGEEVETATVDNTLKKFACWGHQAVATV